MSLPKLALFDLDHTLIPIDSDYSWGQFTVSLGWTDPVEFTRLNDQFYAQYKAGTLDIYAYARFASAAFVAQGEAAARQAHARYMAEIIAPALRPQALDLVRSHKDQGATVLLVTATNEFVTGPIAQAFGADELLAVDLQRDASGWFTQEVRGVPTFREGKVARVQAWLAARNLGWDDVHSTFYSDSINDLPLLEKANVPVATNPDEPLRAIALERGWRILELFA
jgi:HAD superfamily hydrolase (TIGR01490 family)